jgi:hypothetical protein
VSFKYEVEQPGIDVFQLVETETTDTSIVTRVIAESHLSEEIYAVKQREETLREEHSFADIHPIKAKTKPDELPNKYSILQSDTGKWQILKKTEKDGHWMVYVKDCGTKRLAVLMLNAIMQSIKDGTPEQRIMSASDA